MRNRIISVLLAAVLLFSMAPLAFAASKPTLTVSSATAKPGETITLSVTISNNPGINSFSLGFSYDETKLKLKDVDIAKALGGQFVYKTKAVWLASQDTKYNGEILSLKFKVLSDATAGDTKVKVTYSPGDIINYNEKDVNPKVVAGTVTITGSGKQPDTQPEKQSLWAKIVSALKKLLAKITSIFGKK